MKSPEANPEVLVVGTHDGELHPDEVYAVATLTTALKERPNDFSAPEIEVVRSRDAADLAKCDILIDVGSEYNPVQGKFDHHQKGGVGERPNGMPYSSFGLIWREYGRTVCYGDQTQADFIDSSFVQLIDAYDNGHQLFEVAESAVSSLVPDLKPGQDIFNCNAYPDMTEEEKFNHALGVATLLLDGRVRHAAVVCKDVDAIKQAIKESERTDIIKLPNVVGTSWQETLPWLSKDARFVIQEEDGVYAVRAVPVRANGNSRSILFPELWGGIEDAAELQYLTGVEGVTFIHAGGFFAKTDNEEAAVQLANRAVELARVA